MTRRLILATCLIGVIGGTAGSALAGPVRHHGHELCVVLTRHDDTTQDYCVNWDSAQTKH